jgi:hypothetical protein
MFSNHVVLLTGAFSGCCSGKGKIIFGDAGPSGEHGGDGEWEWGGGF